MPSRPTAATEEAWQALLVAHSRLLPQLDSELRRSHDLPLEWYDVLVQLAQAGGTLTMGQLAGRLLIGASRCSRRVDRMVDVGLLERRRDERDSRVIHARLTDPGRALQRRAAVTHLQGVETHFGRFLDDDLASRMGRALRAAVADLDPPSRP